MSASYVPKCCGLIVALLAGAMPSGAQSPTLTGTEGRVKHLQPSDPDWARIVGSYDVRVCRRGSDCMDDSSRDALQKSFVSIQSDSIQLLAFDPDTRTRLDVGSVGHGPWNACYIAGPRLHRSSNYASMSSMGMFATEPTAGSPQLRLWLGASVDADYEVDATIINGRLEGVGRSSMVGNDLHVPADTVVGRRIGPPDVERCLAVAVPHNARHSATGHVATTDTSIAAPPLFKASDRSRLPARLGAYTRDSPATTAAGVSQATYVNGGTRIEVTLSRIAVNADDALRRTAAEFDALVESTQRRRGQHMDDTVTINGARYSGVRATAIARGDDDVGLCLWYAFALGKTLLRETAVVPTSQIATTDVPLFAHELARHVVTASAP